MRSDHELIDAVRSGDTSAANELYSRHVDSARGAAYRIAPSLDLDDLVSESFTRIFEILARGGGPREAFRPYLYQVIRNAAIDQSSTANPEVELSEEFADPATPEDTLDVAERNEALASAFESLPERWQTVLWYTVVEKLPPRKVAPLLGLSSGNVAQIASRARTQLRTRLEADGMAPLSEKMLSRSLAVIVLGGGTAGALLGTDLGFIGETDQSESTIEAMLTAPGTAEAVGAAGASSLGLKLLIGGGVTGLALISGIFLNSLWQDQGSDDPATSVTQTEDSQSADEDVVKPTDKAKKKTAAPEVDSGSDDNSGGNEQVTTETTEIEPGPWEEVPRQPPVVRGPE